MKTKILFFITLFLISEMALSVTNRNPNGVNVKATGSTTVFITFQGTAGQTSTEAKWCGQLTGAIPGNGIFNADPCVPGTVFGRLPRKLTQARSSGNGVTNLTDIMTVPTSVARRAYQDAQSGNVSSFFYVRKFTDGNPVNDQWVVVTCRLAGGGARVPLALMKVNPYFVTQEGKKPITIVSLNDVAPRMGATIFYNGSGRLKGRWEIVQPGDQEPTDFDLLPEASLPVEQRGLQKRYQVLDRFDIFLPPTGKVDLPGPLAETIPTSANGPYKLILRIEATKDKEGNSNTTVGTAISGGVSGFPMPVLRYYVGSPEEIEQARLQSRMGEISLLLPQEELRASPGEIMQFSWTEVADSSIYRLEVKDGSGVILSALVNKGAPNYSAPPWLLERAQDNLQWRVIAVGKNGSDIAASAWRTILLN